MRARTGLAHEGRSLRLRSRRLPPAGPWRLTLKLLYRGIRKFRRSRQPHRAPEQSLSTPTRV